MSLLSWAEFQAQIRSTKPSLWKRLKWKVWGDAWRGGIYGGYYWLKSKVWTRHHLIDLTGMDGYSHGWIETDHAMELACWKLLVDFIEKQDPVTGTLKTPEEFWPDHTEWYEGEREMLQAQIDREMEIRALYDWWTKERPAIKKDLGRRWEELEDGHSSPKGRALYEEGETLEEKDDAQLLRLMKIRRCLWT